MNIRDAINIVNNCPRLNELTYPRDIIRSIENKTETGLLFNNEVLLDKGFVPIGNGHFGTVFSHPKLDYVLKILSAKDTSYRNYIALVKQHPSNPHFPKFRGNLIGISKSIVGIRMEKLSPVHIDDYRIEYMLRYIEMTLLGETFPRVENIPPLLRVACAFIRTIVNETSQIDIHYGNVMERGDVLVIIDPLASLNTGGYIA